MIGLGTDDSGTMIQINIPEPYWNTTSYRSTLGHKANHSFVKIKAMFNFASHPRFGWVRALTAIEDIYQGSMKLRLLRQGRALVDITSSSEVRNFFKIQTVQKLDIFTPGRRTFNTFKNRKNGILLPKLF